MVDFLIIGQGLAGSVLSLSLIKKGYSVFVIDKPSVSMCSKVAAGIWNPVVFKRLTKSWLADEVIPELYQFYQYYEKEFNESFLHSKLIIKPFTEEQEKTLWLKKASIENNFLQAEVFEDFALTTNATLKNYSLVNNAGNLEVVKFLELTTKHLIVNQSYLQDEFDFEELKNNNTHFTYKSIFSKHVICCEGYLITKNPYFNWVPLKPAKGETLTIQCDDLNLNDCILNKSIYILPLQNNTYKVGATYEWQDLTDNPTQKGKEELVNKLRSVLKIPFTIINHDAGVRPAIIDRRPVIGSHPQFKNMFVFNGFGSKAVMLAPYFANQFTEYLADDTCLHNEANVQRFYKFHKN